jgi:hypothetical protein
VRTHDEEAERPISRSLSESSDILERAETRSVVLWTYLHFEYLSASAENSTTPDGKGVIVYAHYTTNLLAMGEE